MGPKQIYTRSALNGAVAGVIALAAAIVGFGVLGSTPVGSALLIGIAFGVVVFALVGGINYLVLRAKHPRERPPERMA
jgi:purine-cytosine permease-like protein